jgi:hypothetical protein
MDDANAAVARAICEELVRMGLVARARAQKLEQSIQEGTTNGELWSFEVEAALPAKHEQRTDVRQAH